VGKPKGASEEDTIEYFETPKYSVDGSKILMWRSFRTTSTEDLTGQAMTISPDGSGQHKLTKGKPLGWAASGKAIFIIKGEEPETTVVKYDLASGATEVVKGLQKTPRGKLRNEDAFAVDNYGWLGLVTVTDAVAGAMRTLPLPTALAPDAADLSGFRSGRQPPNGGFSLTQVSSDRSGSYLLLLYRGGLGELLQVVKIK